MKKILLATMMALLMLPMCAQDKQDNKKMPPKRLSPEEFRTKQQQMLKEAAGLTDDEAAKFFPVYFELQDKKKELNEAYKPHDREKQKSMTEQEYEKALDGMAKAAQKSAELEKEYLAKFKKIISCEKIYKVNMAEARFHRQLLKGMGPGQGRPGRQGGPRPPRGQNQDNPEL